MCILLIYPSLTNTGEILGLRTDETTDDNTRVASRRKPPATMNGSSNVKHNSAYSPVLCGEDEKDHNEDIR